MSDQTVIEEAEISATEMQNVEALLGDLDLDASDAVAEPIGELDDAAEEAVIAAEAEAAVYEDQPTTPTAIEAPAPTTETATEAPKKAKRAKKATASKPRVVRDIATLEPGTFALTEADKASADDALRDRVIAKRPTQKKIADKFDNLFLSIAAGKKPSVYTMACFKVLMERPIITLSDLTTALQHLPVSAGKTKGASYNIGTARSQAGQMMILFTTVGIAENVAGAKHTIKLLGDSVVADKLMSLS